MIKGRKIFVIMPAYNAARTVEQTFRDIDRELIDEVVLVDDCSEDGTARKSRDLGIVTYVHEKNRGYGGNQKTCYRLALEMGADVVVMVHPDYQYDPRLAGTLASMVANDVYDCVIASRIIGGGALRGGMPRYKYVANRFLTFVQNILVGQKMSEYHTGYRAFSREVLLSLPLLENSDDFVFDNEILAQAIHFGYRIGEISCPTKYFEEASSINFARSCRYGLGVLAVSAKVILQRAGLARFAFLDRNGKKIQPAQAAVTADARRERV
ncbi:MAG: glycosyltransferase family 2 protein [Candidatus Sumerlaeia bacterium]